MKRLPATQVIVTVYVHNTGSAISRSIFERGVEFSDRTMAEILAMVWEFMIFVSFIAGLWAVARRDFYAGLEAIGYIYFCGVTRYVWPPNLAFG